MPRTDQEWLEQLKQVDNSAVLEDLRLQLARGLTFALAGRVAPEQLDELVQDFAQESVLRVLSALDTFRGESRFLTWAVKVAVRLAFSELRRKRWQDVSLDGLMENQDGPEEANPALADPAPSPETAVNRAMLMALVERLIDDELTERQRDALRAVFEGGISVEELARRNGTSRNALYKLVHDARRRLQARLQQHGLTPADLLAAMETR
jgi:RNA polymerase sigma-70 factor (ECF subfamily)